jgi:hypothetical protein
MSILKDVLPPVGYLQKRAALLCAAKSVRGFILGICSVHPPAADSKKFELAVDPRRDEMLE